MHKDESFADRVKRLRTAAKLTQAQFAQRLLVSRDYVSQIENGREPGPRLVQQVDLLERVGIAPALDNDSVGTGVLGEPDPTAYGLKPLRSIAPHEVPVVSWARAGSATNFEEIPKDWQRTIYTACRVPDSFGIEVEGDSMAPDFRAGDIVVVMPEVEPRNHHAVVAKLRSDGVVLKNYTRNRDGTITLTSINPAYAPLVFGPEEFDWIYPVHSTVRMNWK